MCVCMLFVGLRYHSPRGSHCAGRYQNGFCDFFAAWGARTSDGSFISSRNLDFDKDTGISQCDPLTPSPQQLQLSSSLPHPYTAHTHTPQRTCLDLDPAACGDPAAPRPWNIPCSSLCKCVNVCLPAYLPARLSACAYLPACLLPAPCPPVRLPACLPACPPACPPACGSCAGVHVHSG